MVGEAGVHMDLVRKPVEVGLSLDHVLVALVQLDLLIVYEARVALPVVIHSLVIPEFGVHQERRHHVPQHVEHEPTLPMDRTQAVNDHDHVILVRSHREILDIVQLLQLVQQVVLSTDHLLGQ